MDNSILNEPYVSDKKPKVDIINELLETNNMILKVAVLLVVVVLFIIVFRFSIYILGKYLSTDTSPKVVDGLKKAQTPYIVKQDPVYDNSVTIMRSKNKNKGIEFTWSVWIFIDDIMYLKNQHRHIFHKGNLNLTSPIDDSRNGINFPNNAPGMYICPNSNDLLIVMNTFSTINEDVKVKSIPVNKWLNVIVRVEGQTLDVYINGLVVARRILNDVPKQNYGDVYVNQNGGFSGYLSDLRYFDHAASITEVNNIMRSGPNLTTNKSLIDSSNSFPYLSLNWFLYNDV